MTSFLSKVFPRKKDKETSNKRNSASSLLEGKFEAVSPTVSPSAAHFVDSAQLPKERGREKEKEKEKEIGFSLFKPKSRPTSPPPDTRKPVSNAPHLTLSLPVPKEERSRALGVVFEVDPNDTSTLSDKVIGERRLTPLETLLLVKACSSALIDHGGLETLGVMHPFWYSASHEVQRKLISLYILSLASKSPITTLSPSPTSGLANFNSELEYTRSPHDIAAVLRWAVRHLRLEGESFGRETEQWKWYQTFAEAERTSSYPSGTFTDVLVPQLPPSHHQLLVATLEIISSLASHSEHNGISGSKLSKFLGLWLLTVKRSEDGEDWNSFYARWERAGRILEHLFLAYIRDEMVRKQMPLRLAELVKGYPYHSRSSSTTSAPVTDNDLLPRPRFSTRQYDALFVRVDTELHDTQTPQPKPHPLRLILDALKSDLALTDAQYQVIWEAIRRVASATNEPEPILTHVDGYPSLSRIFADETTRLLSFVPAESTATGPSIPTIRPPRPPRRRSSSLNASSQPQINGNGKVNETGKENGNGKANTNGSAARMSRAFTSPTSPTSPKDWSDFSSSGFGESTLGSDFAKTLLDKDVEVTAPPAVERRTSKKRKPSPRRSSVDSPDPASATRATELSPAKTPPKSKSTFVSLIKLDEAFVDFWSDALLDPITSDWPNFVVAQLKALPGVEAGGNPIQWLVLEQRFIPPTPPPKTATEETATSPTNLRRASSPRPSVRSEMSSRKSSTFSSAMKQRLTFFSSSSQTITGATAKSEAKAAAKTEAKTASAATRKRAAKAPKVGEMGEILPEVDEKPEDKKDEEQKDTATAAEASKAPVPEATPAEKPKPGSLHAQEVIVPGASFLPAEPLSPTTPTADDFPPVPVVSGLVAAASGAVPVSIEAVKTEDATTADTPVVTVPDAPAVPADAPATSEEKELPPAPEAVVLTGETPGPQVALSTSEPAALAEISHKVDHIVNEASSEPEIESTEPAPAETAAPVVESPSEIVETDAVEKPAPVVAVEPVAIPELEAQVAAVEEAPVVEEPPAVEAPVVEEPPVVEEAPIVEEVSAIEEAPAVETAPVVEEAPAPEPIEPELTSVEPTPVEPAPTAPAEPEAVAAPEPESAAPVEPEPVAPVEPEPAAPVVPESVAESTPVEEPQPPSEEAAAPVFEEVSEPVQETVPVIEEPEKPGVEEPPAPEPEPVVVEETSAVPEEPVVESTPAVDLVAEAPAAVPEPSSVSEAEPEVITPAPVEETPIAVEEAAAAKEPTTTAEEPVAVVEEPALPTENAEEEFVPAHVEEPTVVEEPATAPVEEPVAEPPSSKESSAPVEEEVVPIAAEEVPASAPIEEPVAPAPAEEVPAAVPELAEEPAATPAPVEEPIAVAEPVEEPTPAAVEESTPGAESSETPAEPAEEPAVQEGTRAEESAAEEPPAATSEEPAAPTPVVESAEPTAQAEESVVEEKHENGAAHSEESPVAAEESQ